MTIASESIPAQTPRRNILSLVNLLLREEPHRLTVLTIGEDTRDPPLYIVTQIKWRDVQRGLMSQLPTVLSYLEVMRGTKGVPTKVPLEGDEGLQLYIPTDIHVSDIPDDSKESVGFLRRLIQEHITFTQDTAKEVEATFWGIARSRGFSPEIVDKMEERTTGFANPSNLQRYQDLMQRYFSVKFRVHTAESELHVEDD